MSLPDKPTGVYNHEPRYTLSEAQHAQLWKLSNDAKKSAYCPYSHFRVGCAILIETSDGQSDYITGANVENAAYPAGICAERVAMSYAIAQGHRAGAFKAIAVCTDLDEACSPCGMCRQFLREFCALEIPIIMFDQNGKNVTKTMGDLLPLSFGPDALEKMNINPGGK